MDIQTVLFYLSVFILTLGLCICFQDIIKKNKSEKKLWKNILICAIISLPCLLVAGLRADSVGKDTAVYTEWFYDASSDSFRDYFDTIAEDYLFSFFLFVFSHKEKEPIFFYLFVQACVMIPLLVIGIKHIESISLWKVVSIYLFWHYNDSLNLSRQMVSILWLILMSEFFFEKKYFLSIVSYLFAVGFHSSAIMVGLFIMLSCFLFYNYIGPYITVAITAVFFVFAQKAFIYFVDTGLFSSRYNLYVDTFIYQDTRVVDSWLSVGFGGIFEVLVRVLIIVFFLVNAPQIIQNKTREKVFFYFFVLGTIIYASGMIYFKTTYLVRISTYFDCFGIFLIPYLDSTQKNSIRFSLFFSFCYWVVHVLLLGQGGSFPYLIR